VEGNYMEIVQERHRWLVAIFAFLHLLDKGWARRIVEKRARRRVVGVDSTTGTVTLDRPFPKGFKSGDHIVEQGGNN